MSTGFPDYHSAFAHAVRLARLLGKEVGIEAAKEYGKPIYRVFSLPKPENRFGHELRCQVVTPDEPSHRSTP